MAEDETTFLCGFKGQRRYGTTSSSSSMKIPKYSTIIKHRVLPSDTLQGIALKYGASTTEIKRLNKLWSNDSIHLREILHIPILPGEPSSSSMDPGSSASVSTSVVNGRDSCYDSMSETEDQQYHRQKRVEGKASISEKDEGEQRNIGHTSAVAPKPRSNSEQKKMASDYDKSDCSIKDLLNRIDSSIKITAKNVKKLEKQSTIDSLVSETTVEGTASPSMSTSQSRHSLRDSLSFGAPSPPEIRSQVRRPPTRYTMSQLQDVHDQLYQL